MNQAIVWLDPNEVHKHYVNGSSASSSVQLAPRNQAGSTATAGFVVTAAAVEEVRNQGSMSQTLQDELLHFYQQLIVRNGLYQPAVQISTSQVHQDARELGTPEIVLGSTALLHKIESLMINRADQPPFALLVQPYQPSLELQPYTALDREQCLAIFESNLPTFFAPEEENKFGNFLDDYPTDPADYFVLKWKGELVGCGGFWLERERARATLLWGMIRRERQRQGFGSYLLLARLQTIGLQAADCTVLIDTSQHSYPFYARFGFDIQQINENYYSSGLHRYDMALQLDQPKRRWIAEQLGKREE